MSWLIALALIQGLLWARVAIRMAAGGREGPIPRRTHSSRATVTIVVPVLDEESRLGACLDGAIAQPGEVREILVVDGGSTDGTAGVIARYAARDPRVRLLDASPVPADAAGKAWGLLAGLDAAGGDWVLFLDADTRVAPDATRSLLAHADEARLEAFSVATLQHLGGRLQGLIHPALLTTLVYRFGPPGRRTSNPDRVQANGQCFLARRDVLVSTGALAAARASLCEDITTARHLAGRGVAIGFYETEALIHVRMYATAGEAWRDWTRSLPMRDQYFGAAGVVGLLEIILVQALPLPLVTLVAATGGPAWFLALQTILGATRIGVLFGTARAYPERPWTYWLSPLADLPVAWQLMRRALQHRHRWRGSTYVRQRDGRFRLESRAVRGGP